MPTDRYLPSLYDLVLGTKTDDVAWWVSRAQDSGGPVLEIGAGTGRTLLPVARQGIDIDGLDLSAPMLDRLRTKLAAEPDEVRQRVGVFEGDMRTFDLGRTYRHIQIPFRAFLHNLTRDDQLATLSRCFAHLQPGGTITFEVFFPSLHFMSQATGAFAGLWRVRGMTALPDGTQVLLSDTTAFDTPRQQLTSLHRYEVLNAEGMVVRIHLQQLHLAYLYPGDLRDLLATSGFVDVVIGGGFEGGPLDDDAQDQVVTARRPA